MSRKQASELRPAARSEQLIVEKVGDETVIYDLDSKEAHCLKALAAVVFDCADGASNASDIAELASYRLARPVTEAEVLESLAQLDDSSLLVQPSPSEQNGVSRRQALRTFAAAGAGTILVTTVSAPAALAWSTGSTCKALTPSCTPDCSDKDGSCSGCLPCDEGHPCPSGYVCCQIPCQSKSSSWSWGYCSGSGRTGYQTVCVAGSTCSSHRNGCGYFKPCPW